MAYMFLISLRSTKLSFSGSNSLPPYPPAPKFLSVYQLLVIFVGEKTGYRNKRADLLSIGGSWRGDK